MKKIIDWSGLRILRDWKVRALLVFFVAFFGSFSLMYRQQVQTYPHEDMKEEYVDEQQIYRLIPPNHFNSEIGREVQQVLGSNSVSLGTNHYILKHKEGRKIEGVSFLPNYAENGRKIAENNRFLYGATDFESHDLLLREYLPTIESIEQQIRFYNALEENNLDVEWNYLSAAQVLKVEIELLAGFLLFLLIAILASDHFTKDQVSHWSVTHGLPVPWKTQWRTRSLILLGLFWASVLLGIGISYFVGNIIDTSGSLLYPSEIYLSDGIHYIPQWQYLILILLITMLLSYLLMLITTGLSWITRNFYLTILIVSGLFLIPQIWQLIPAFSSWQPSLYLDFMGVLNGNTAMTTGLNNVVWWKAPVMYCVSIVGLELIFSGVFSKIPTATFGLKRRVNV